MKTKPNILYIMSDSLSPHYMGCYDGTTGCTPNLDKIAKGGVMFENAYCSSPLCAPSRASMLTGRYVSDICAFDNASEFSSEWPTFAHMLKKQGYETTIVGKMHIVGYDQYHGFDHRLALDEDYTKGYDPDVYCIAYDWNQPSGMNPVGQDWMAPSYVDDSRWDDYRHHHDKDMRIHEQAVKYLKDKDGESEPFFCCVSYHHPHNPFYAPKEVRERFVDSDYELPEMPEDLDYGVMEKWLNDFHGVPGLREYFMKEENLKWLYETYLAMVFDMDMHAGELVRILEEKGILEDTVIIFASDHGDMMGHRGMVQKRSFYDRSSKVPLIFSFPGTFCEGRRVLEPVSLLDLFPTLADIAGGKTPSDLPGISLIEVLSGKSDIIDSPIFCEYHGEGVHAPCFMVREGKYKYIYVHGFEELIYDLYKDPEEMHNLIGEPEMANIVSRLKRRILDEFDPNEVSKNALKSQRNRKYIYDCIGKGDMEDNPF